MAETKTVRLGGREFQAGALPWGKLRQIMGAINRVGRAAAANTLGDPEIDDLEKVLQMGLNLSADELQAIETDIFEILQAFNTIVAASGLEKVMGEALRAGLVASPATSTASIPGTPSTQT